MMSAHKTLNAISQAKAEVSLSHRNHQGDYHANTLTLDDVAAYPVRWSSQNRHYIYRSTLM